MKEIFFFILCFAHTFRSWYNVFHVSSIIHWVLPHARQRRAYANERYKKDSHIYFHSVFFSMRFFLSIFPSRSRSYSVASEASASFINFIVAIRFLLPVKRRWINRLSLFRAVALNGVSFARDFVAARSVMNWNILCVRRFVSPPLSPAHARRINSDSKCSSFVGTPDSHNNGKPLKHPIKSV